MGQSPPTHLTPQQALGEPPCLVELVILDVAPGGSLAEAPGLVSSPSRIFYPLGMAPDYSSLASPHAFTCPIWGCARSGSHSQIPHCGVYPSAGALCPDPRAGLGGPRTLHQAASLGATDHPHPPSAPRASVLPPPGPSRPICAGSLRAPRLLPSISFCPSPPLLNVFLPCSPNEIPDLTRARGPAVPSGPHWPPSLHEVPPAPSNRCLPRPRAASGTDRLCLNPRCSAGPRVQILPLQLTPCVTLGKCPPLSEPQFSQPRNESVTIPDL